MASSDSRTATANSTPALAAAQELPVPEGFKPYLLENVMETRDSDERTDFAQGADRPQELISYGGLQLVANLSWSFSFQKREQKTEAYYANLAEQQELERTR